MNTPDPHRVGQVRNDVEDIYVMLGGINSTLGQHTATLADRSSSRQKFPKVSPASSRSARKPASATG